VVAVSKDRYRHLHASGFTASQPTKRYAWRNTESGLADADYLYWHMYVLEIDDVRAWMILGDDLRGCCRRLLSLKDAVSFIWNPELGNVDHLNSSE